MGKRWIRFEDEALQSRLIAKAEQLGAGFSVDPDGRIWFDDDEWADHGDPEILALDDAFGPEWVAVYADDPGQRSERIAVLHERGIRFIVWSDGSSDGSMATAIVLDKSCCPADWEYA